MDYETKAFQELEDGDYFRLPGHLELWSKTLFFKGSLEYNAVNHSNVGAFFNWDKRVIPVFARGSYS